MKPEMSDFLFFENPGWQKLSCTSLPKEKKDGYFKKCFFIHCIKSYPQAKKRKYRIWGFIHLVIHIIHEQKNEITGWNGNRIGTGVLWNNDRREWLDMLFCIKTRL